MKQSPSAFDLRVFALLQAPFIVYLASRLMHWGLPQTFVYGICTASGLAAVLGVVEPKAVQGYYQLWMAMVSPLGWVVTHAILVVVFYGIVTPIGLIRRTFSEDPLRRNPESIIRSYWLGRSGPKATERYFQQF